MIALVKLSVTALVLGTRESAPTVVRKLLDVFRGHEMRQNVCHCGREYEQFRIPEGLREKCAREIPGGWVPVDCPPCESRELDATSRDRKPSTYRIPTNTYERDERLAMQDAE